VTVSVNALQDDDQNSFSSTVSVENATAPGPAAPDLSGDGSPAKDLDGDSLYEDANGDGKSNILDVAVLLGTFDSIDAEFTALFDFTADGRINILDVSALLGMT
jgi:PKD repeat protein